MAMTNGLNPQLVGIMERLVAYTPVFMHYDPNSVYNPPSFFHYNVSDGRGRYDLLARVSACGLDHTKRSNKIGHFFLISEQEKWQLSQGPSSLLNDSSLFITEWRGEPQLFPNECMLNIQDIVQGKASAWEQVTGDAGWAAWLASQYLARPDRPCFVLFDPLRQTNLQLLVSESLMLLPPNKRWEVTWNTYLTELPVGQSCHWRFCVKNPELLNRIGYQGNAPVLDLTQGLGVADNSQLCQCARTGENPYPRATDKPGNIQTATVEQDDGLSLSALMRKRQEEAARAAAEAAEAARRKAEQQAQEAMIPLMGKDDNPWANNSVNTPRANPFRLKGNSPQLANMGMPSNNSPWGNKGVNMAANTNPHGQGFGVNAYDNNFNQNGMGMMFNTLLASSTKNRSLLFMIGSGVVILQVLTIGLVLFLAIMSRRQQADILNLKKKQETAASEMVNAIGGIEQLQKKTATELGNLKSDMKDMSARLQLEKKSSIDKKNERDTMAQVTGTKHDTNTQENPQQEDKAEKTNKLQENKQEKTQNKQSKEASGEDTKGDKSGAETVEQTRQNNNSQPITGK